MRRTILLQLDAASAAHAAGFSLTVQDGTLLSSDGIGGLTQAEDSAPILRPAPDRLRWAWHLWMHYVALRVTIDGDPATALVIEGLGNTAGPHRIPLDAIGAQAQPLLLGHTPDGHAGTLLVATETAPAAGQFTIEPQRVEAGAETTFTLEFTVGEGGIATGGTLQLVMPYSSWSNPSLFAGAVTAQAKQPVELACSVAPNAIFVFGHVYTIRVSAGRLEPGDRIRVLCAGEGGQPLRVQTYPKPAVYFAASLDAQGRGIFAPLPLAQQAHVAVVAGPPRRLRLVAPMVVRAGEPFTARTLLLDVHYNPAAAGAGCEVELSTEPASVRRTQPVTLTSPDGLCLYGADFDSIQLSAPGLYVLTARAAGLEPQHLVIRCDVHEASIADRRGLYFGSIHGHTLMSDGEFEPDTYYRYGRSVGLLDFCALADHDWELVEHARSRALGGFIHVQQLAAAYDAPGRFVTLPGYEWMGEDGEGHANVYFNNARTDNAAYVGRVSILDTYDTPTLADLLAHYAGRTDVMIIPHSSHGCTWLSYDPALMPLVEMYSCWGNSEFRLHGTAGVRAALSKGWRFGFIGGADSHHGSPGHTGQPSKYAILSEREGFAAVWAPTLERGSLFDAMMQRRCYATSGERIYLEFSVADLPMGSAGHAHAGASLAIRATVGGTQPIERIELLADGEVVDSRTGTGHIEHYCHALPAQAGAHDYYVRITQRGGAMAWSSPIWFDCD